MAVGRLFEQHAEPVLGRLSLGDILDRSQDLEWPAGRVAAKDDLTRASPPPAAVDMPHAILGLDHLAVINAFEAALGVVEPEADGIVGVDQLGDQGVGVIRR